jgi:hypothetical protein
VKRELGKEKVNAWCEEYDLPISVCPYQEDYKKALRQKKAFAEAIAEDWDTHKAYAQKSKLRKDWLMEEAGLKAPLLSDLELKAEAKLLEYRENVIHARALWEKIEDEEPRSAFRPDHPLYIDYLEHKAKRK